MDEKKFIDSVIPGNYNLTKSMELTKFKTSGTLWYTKKFLVLYYIVFLSDSLYSNDYFKMLNYNFGKFISSLDNRAHPDAYSLFFNGHKEFNKQNTKSFYEFCGIDKKKKKDDFPESDEAIARKFYFAYLMKSGGQSGVKYEIRKNLEKPDFVFSINEINKIINQYRSENGLKQNNSTIIADYPAFIRNERQILYYWGFFHSKSLGASDLEFSSLTPIGELAFKANYPELLVIWEHQKLKMTSQPTVVEINNLTKSKEKFNNFSINYSPYLDILKFLERYGQMSFLDYKYIVSRNKEGYNFFSIRKPNIKNIKKQVKNKTKKFNRKADISNEDYQKELKKYLLGIVNARLDYKYNPFAFLNSLTDIKVNNPQKLNFIIQKYKKIDEYKRIKYKNLLDSNLEELKRYYFGQVANKKTEKNKKAINNWNLYIGSFDPIIIINLIIVYYFLEKKNYQLRLDEKDFKLKTYNFFPNFIEVLSLSEARLEEMVMSWHNDGFSTISDNQLTVEFEERYLRNDTQDLKKKIIWESTRGDNYSGLNVERKRNSTLISLLGAYYIKKYDTIDENSTEIKCEACNQPTFITQNDRPYMEFHHIIPFGGETQGPDHYLNLINLCPNCHKKIHHLKVEDKKLLYAMINKNNYLQSNIKERILLLKRNNMLKSYQLEFLLAENAITEEEYEIIEKDKHVY